MISRRPLLLAALAAPSLAEAQVATRTLRFIPQGNLANIDPVWSTTVIARNHGLLIYDTLFGLGADFRPKPQMAAGAEVSADGMLNIRVFFPGLKQTREYGLIRQTDGTMRAIYNRDQKDEYTIKDGKFTANGSPTPAQHRCR
jgi:hypothetical protein